MSEEQLHQAMAAVRIALRRDLKPGESVVMYLGSLTEEQHARLAHAADSTGLCSGSTKSWIGNDLCGPFTFTRNMLPAPWLATDEVARALVVRGLAEPIGKG